MLPARFVLSTGLLRSKDTSADSRACRELLAPSVEPVRVSAAGSARCPGVDSIFASACLRPFQDSAILRRWLMDRASRERFITVTESTWVRAAQQQDYVPRASGLIHHEVGCVFVKPRTAPRHPPTCYTGHPVAALVAREVGRSADGLARIPPNVDFPPILTWSALGGDVCPHRE